MITFSTGAKDQNKLKPEPSKKRRKEEKRKSLHRVVIFRPVVGWFDFDPDQKGFSLLNCSGWVEGKKNKGEKRNEKNEKKTKKKRKKDFLALLPHPCW